MLGNRLTLRSKLPQMVRQELWGILLTYNLVRYQMLKMSQHLQGEYYPCELSFTGMLAQIFRLLIGLPYTNSPGAVPRQLNTIYEMAEVLILPGRRERSCPRVVKRRPKRYPEKCQSVS